MLRKTYKIVLNKECVDKEWRDIVEKTCWGAAKSYDLIDLY